MIMMMQTREMLVQGYALDTLFRHEKIISPTKISTPPAVR